MGTKNIYVKILSAVTAFFICTCSFGQFTGGNLAVLRIATSTVVPNFVNTGNEIHLTQFSTLDGSATYDFALPTSGVNAMALSGTATSEGSLSLSSDFRLLCFGAYNTVPGSGSSLPGSSSSVVLRLAATVDQGGILSVNTTSAFSANNPRSATSNGIYVWEVGANTGVELTSPVNQLVSNTNTNIRTTKIFNGQLYYATGSGSNRGIYAVGTGTPTTSVTSSIVVNTGTSSSPYGFNFNSTYTGNGVLTSNILYIADDNTTGGVQKWGYSGSAWTLLYTLTTTGAANVGARSLAVDWNASTPTIYAVTVDNRLVKITDNGDVPSSTLSVLAVSALGTIFRGVDFTPTVAPTSHVSSLSATSGNQTVALNWTSATGADGYVIVVSTGTGVAPINGYAAVPLATSNGLFFTYTNSLVATITGLTNGVSYNFNVYPYAGTGFATTYKLDGFIPSVSAIPLNTAEATELAIIDINGGNAPTVNVPFSITVQSQNLNGTSANVTQNTTVNFVVLTGTGVLSTVTGVLYAGSNTVTIYTAYNVAETNVVIGAISTSGDVLSSVIGIAFNTLQAASQLSFINVPTTATSNSILGSFTVSALRPDLSVDNTFSGNITVAKQSGVGNLSGTLTQVAINGVATFNDLQFDASGAYIIDATSGALTQAVSPTISIAGLITDLSNNSESSAISVFTYGDYLNIAFQNSPSPSADLYVFNLVGQESFKSLGVSTSGTKSYLTTGFNKGIYIVKIGFSNGTVENRKIIIQ